MYRGLSQAFAPERRVSNASTDAPISFEQRMQDMRDFRHAKAMARTLRASLAARGFKITVRQSLELIAEAFGLADWHTLPATIRAEALPVTASHRLSFRLPGAALRFPPRLNRRSAGPSPAPTGESTSTQRWSICYSP